MAQNFPILEKIGGRQAAFTKLKKAGHDIKTVHAIRMWIARGQIPGDAQRLLMAECEKSGLAYCADDFILADIDSASSGAAA